MRKKTLMILIFIVFCIITISAQSSFDTTGFAKNNYLDTSIIACNNQILPMFITKAELETHTKHKQFLRLYIQFKTDDGKNFYGDTYVWKHGDVDYSAKHLLNIGPGINFILNTYPYVLGNLELRRDSLKPVVAAKIYTFEPTIKDGYVVYDIYAYPDTSILAAIKLYEEKNNISEKSKEYEQLNLKPVDKLLSKDFIEKIFLFLVTQTKTLAGSLNPCPPKKPDTNR